MVAALHVTGADGEYIIHAIPRIYTSGNGVDNKLVTGLEFGGHLGVDGSEDCLLTVTGTYPQLSVATGSCKPDSATIFTNAEFDHIVLDSGLYANHDPTEKKFLLSSLPAIYVAPDGPHAFPNTLVTGLNTAGTVSFANVANCTGTIIGAPPSGRDILITGDCKSVHNPTYQPFNGLSFGTGLEFRLMDAGGDKPQEFRVDALPQILVYNYDPDIAQENQDSTARFATGISGAGNITFTHDNCIYTISGSDSLSGVEDLRYGCDPPLEVVGMQNITGLTFGSGLHLTDEGDGVEGAKNYAVHAIPQLYISGDADPLEVASYTGIKLSDEWQSSISGGVSNCQLHISGHRGFEARDKAYLCDDGSDYPSNPATASFDTVHITGLTFGSGLHLDKVNDGDYQVNAIPRIRVYDEAEEIGTIVTGLRPGNGIGFVIDSCYATIVSSGGFMSGCNDYAYTTDCYPAASKPFTCGSADFSDMSKIIAGTGLVFSQRVGDPPAEGEYFLDAIPQIHVFDDFYEDAGTRWRLTSGLKGEGLVQISNADCVATISAHPKLSAHNSCRSVSSKVYIDNVNFTGLVFGTGFDVYVNHTDGTDYSYLINSAYRVYQDSTHWCTSDSDRVLVPDKTPLPTGLIFGNGLEMVYDNSIQKNPGTNETVCEGKIQTTLKFDASDSCGTDVFGVSEVHAGCGIKLSDGPSAGSCDDGTKHTVAKISID